MKYNHRFRIHAPLARVVEFHRRAASMAAITPPPVIVRIHQTPAVLAEGDTMKFSMWLGPLPVHWLAQIEAVSATGFSDRQLRGPFAHWLHRHTFTAVDEHTTDVLDEITLRLRPHPFWAVVGMGMRLGLPALFAYRAWKTRKLLSENEVIQMQNTPQQSTKHTGIEMQEFETLNDQEYINLETFRKSGIGVKTPVWFVKEDGSLFVRTISNAGKVKRIRNNALVNIAPCNADGSLLGEWLPAQAQVIKNDITTHRIDRLFDQKYGFRKKVFAFISSLFRRRYSFLELKVRGEQ